MNTEHDRWIVIKVGTDTLTNKEGDLDEDQINILAAQIAEIKKSCGRVILVSSGAIAAGRKILNVPKHPEESLETRQMYAAIGQPVLMRRYEISLRIHGVIPAQILLTQHDFRGHNDFSVEKPGSVLRKTLDKFFDQSAATRHNILPIVNENDAVANEEIRFGDNDLLTCLLAEMLSASRVVILTSAQGLLRNIDDLDSVVSHCHPDNETWRSYISKGTSTNGSGGMSSKCDTACRLARKGIPTHIANGRDPRVLHKIFLEDGASPGTLFS